MALFSVYHVRRQLPFQVARALKSQGACDLDSAALAARERHAEVMTDMLDMKFTQQTFEAALPLQPIQIWHDFQHAHDVLLDGELAEHRRFLG